LKFGDLGDLMKQAQAMQEKMAEAQNELAKREVVGQSGASLVKVTMNGRHDVKRTEIDASLLSEDKEILEDLLTAAVNDAVRKVEEMNRDSMKDLTGGIPMPEGFKFPF
jgi:DNA-binding YbaB/EbfC family protein